MRRRLLRISALLLASSVGPGRAAVIENFAGTGVRGFSGDGGPAAEARLNGPSGLQRGPDGALYVCDTGNNRIRRIDPNGTISTFAGTGERGWSGDGGPAAAARLNEPWEIRFDSAGNAFWVERMSSVVREREKATGVIRTIAGSGEPGFSGDGGAATSARFKEPHALAFDRKGDLFVCDIGNHRIRRIDRRTGIISTVAGTGERKPTPDGAPISGTPLGGPRAISFDSAGVLWLVLRDTHALVTLDFSTGTIHRAAGTGLRGFAGDGGPALAAQFNGPKGLAIAPNGDICIADTENHAIRRLVRATGVIVRVAGTGEAGDGPVGEALGCRLDRPHGVYVDADGAVFIGDTEGNRIRVIHQPANPG